MSDKRRAIVALVVYDADGECDSWVRCVEASNRREAVKAAACGLPGDSDSPLLLRLIAHNQELSRTLDIPTAKAERLVHWLDPAPMDRPDHVADIQRRLAEGYDDDGLQAAEDVRDLLDLLGWDSGRRDQKSPIAGPGKSRPEHEQLPTKEAP